MIENQGVTLEVLKRWADRIRNMDFFYRQEINGKQFVAVHAGYIESLAGVDPEVLSHNRRPFRTIVMVFSS